MSASISSHEEAKEKVEGFYLLNKKSIKKSDFDIFHFSVQQKLWQSDYYFQQILSIYDKKNFETNFINAVNIPQEGPETQSSTLKYEVDKEKLAKYCNLYLDGYFASVSSIFDALAHELNTLFKLLKDGQDIYINTILNELKQQSKNSEMYKFLSRIIKKNWWKIINNFRNTLTHESIVATNIETTTNVITKKEELKKIPLPDNPKKRPFTHKKNYELKSFVENFHKNVSSILEHCYKKLLRDLEKSNKLPIKI